ncbi:MAG: efflux RND transporter periplasmic adaptor subunit [Williamsia sp.]|nr:efflux RND transporter periplasmic adaptor subunit [Williamsia sp.]
MQSILKLAAAALMLCFSCVACKEHTATEVKDDKPVPDSVAKQVAISPAVLADQTNLIRLNGKITPDESKQAKVYALVSGKITAVSVELGDHVNKGKQLAVLQSTEVAGVANDVAVAQSNLAMAQKNLQAAEDMYKSNLATEREVTSARLEASKATAELNRATQVSSITGGKNASYVLTAPISGSIIEKTITNNSEVRQDNSTSLFTVADLSTVWVIANVYEADISKIHLGDSVTVNTLASPDKNYTGRIDKIYDVLDPANRTMKVRISMPNPNDELKPEMFVTISAKEASQGQKLSIPSVAVVLDNSKHYVIVKKGAGSLAVREVQVIDRIGDRTFVTGLSEGEQVVTNSQVFIYQALSTQ